MSCDYGTSRARVEASDATPETEVVVSTDQSPYAEIDVTQWPSAGDEQLGTKPKRWLMHPDTGESWLLKYATYSTGSDGSCYRKGDDWAEFIASRVAAGLGTPAAHVELAVERSETVRYGIISKSVLTEDEQSGDSDGELVLGNGLLARPTAPGDRLGYTIDAVQAALANTKPPIGSPPGFGAWDVFAGYLVLDCLIGNTDRHEENWAVIVTPNERRLAPSFDHASSLGFQISDAQRNQRLETRDEGFTPETYARRAKSPFANKPHLIDVASAALDRCTRAVREHWLSACEDVDELVRPIWRVPDDRMSEVARQFAERLLRSNCARLFDQVR